MRRWSVFSLFIVVVIAGCAPAPAPEKSTGTTPASSQEVSLSDEDQALVDKQKTCPVGGTPLGDHGTPIKVMVGTRAVFICCEGCRQPLLDEPEKHLATLDAATAPALESVPASETPAAPAPKEAPKADETAPVKES